MEREQKESALDALFVEESEAMDEELLRDTLITHVQLTADGGVYPLQAFDRLGAEKKILVLLLAKKVFSIRKGEEEKVTPSEIQRIVNIPIGTIKPAVSGLAKRRILETGDGRYWIPNARVRMACRLITEENGGRRPPSIEKTLDEPEAYGPDKIVKAKQIRRGKRDGLGEKVRSLIDNGFFDTPKTASDILNEMHKKAHMCKGSDLPYYLISMVHAHELQREKIETKGRRVWTYKRSGKE